MPNVTMQTIKKYTPACWSSSLVRRRALQKGAGAPDLLFELAGPLVER